MTQLLAAAIAVVDETNARVTDWDRPSPCDGWTAADVLGHITGTLDKVRVLLSDDDYAGQPAQPTGLTGAEAVDAWSAKRSAVLAVLPAADPERIVSTPFGEQSVHQALLRPAADLATHAWDIAASQGERLELSEPLLAVVRQVCQAVPEDAMRRPGLFGPAVSAPADAGPTEQLMAWLGRSIP